MKVFLAAGMLVLFSMFLFMHQQLIAMTAYSVISLIVFVVYGTDKHAARQGNERISEFTLHILALAGGWPGALAAQQVMRHKTRKKSFQCIFLATIIINICAYLFFFSPCTLPVLISISTIGPGNIWVVSL